MESYLEDSEAEARWWRMREGQRDRSTMRTMMDRARTAPMLLPMETGMCQELVEASTQSRSGDDVPLRYITTHTCRRGTNTPDRHLASAHVAYL